MGRKTSSVRTIAGSFYRRILRSEPMKGWLWYTRSPRSKLDDVSTTHFASQLAVNKTKQNYVSHSELKQRKRHAAEHFNSSFNKRHSKIKQRKTQKKISIKKVY